ncbi:MAG: Hsp20/alpha crystallin family protein [Gemmatimonadaceae bacterium]
MTAPVYGRGRTPFSLMRTMMDDMDRFFENFSFGGLRSNLLRDGTALADAVWSPQVETFRRGDKLVIRADLPGLRKDDVNVDVDNDMLTLTGERRDEHEEERDGFYRTERTYGRFYRAIPLPPEVNADQVEASFKDGVLEVSLPAPREEGARRKRIAVR